jgi:Uma2 family endonuclease
MATAIATTPEAVILKPPSLEDLVERLGGIPLSRILVTPAPGTATESDVLEAERRYNRLYELVDGVLVVKTLGYRESMLAGALIEILRRFVKPRKLGLVSAPDGTIRLFPGLVRVPDVSFTSWDHFKERKVPAEPIPSLAPVLAIEVLSGSNTPAEMQRKRGEYFASGTRLVWEVDPEERTVCIYSSDGAVTRLDASQTIDGGEVLPGFSLKLSELFAELDEEN